MKRIADKIQHIKNIVEGIKDDTKEMGLFLESLTLAVYSHTSAAFCLKRYGGESSHKYIDNRSPHASISYIILDVFKRQCNGSGIIVKKSGPFVYSVCSTFGIYEHYHGPEQGGARAKRIKYTNAATMYEYCIYAINAVENRMLNVSIKKETRLEMIEYILCVYEAVVNRDTFLSINKIHG